MGGNVFKDRTRRATLADKEKFALFLNEKISISANEFQFIGSSASNLASKTFGDLDVAINIANSDYLKDIYLDEIRKHYEVVENMGAAFVLFNDVQADLNFIDHDFTFRNWVLPASTVPTRDPFKALYRNEMLFQMIEYFYPKAIDRIEEGRILQFTRPRYTVMEGLRNTTYSYKSEAGNWLTKPHKIKDTYIESGYDFDKFMRTIFNITNRDSYEPTFVNLIEVLRKRIGTAESYFILTKVKNGLIKKNAEIPDVLEDTIEEMKAFIR